MLVKINQLYPVMKVFYLFEWLQFDRVLNGQMVHTGSPAPGPAVLRGQTTSSGRLGGGFRTLKTTNPVIKYLRASTWMLQSIKITLIKAFALPRRIREQNGQKVSIVYLSKV